MKDQGSAKSDRDPYCERQEGEAIKQNIPTSTPEKNDEEE